MSLSYCPTFVNNIMFLSVILEQKIGTEKFCLHRNVGNSEKKNLVKAKAKFSRATFKFFSSMFWSQNADIALLLSFTHCNTFLSCPWQALFLLSSSQCWVCHSSDISNIPGSPWILGFTFTASHSDLSRPIFIDTLATWMASVTFFHQGGGFHNCFIPASFLFQSPEQHDWCYQDLLPTLYETYTLLSTAFS